MSDPVSMMQLIALIGDDDRYKTRLAELEKRERDANEAERKLAEAQSRHDSSKQEAEYFVAKRQNELAAAQLEHDRAAGEAAARIKLGTEQAGELTRLKDELERARSAIDAKMDELEKREKAVAQRERDVERNAQAAAQERAELKARHERLRAAMG